MPTTPAITTRGLGRALLARQHLLVRAVPPGTGAPGTVPPGTADAAARAGAAGPDDPDDPDGTPITGGAAASPDATAAPSTAAAAQDAVVAEVHHLVGLQSQSPTSAYLALHARVEGFRHEHLAAPMLDRRVGRLALLRDTVHLVTAQDAHALHALLAPLLGRRMLSTSGGATLREVDLDLLRERALAVLADGPATARVLGERLVVDFPGRDPGHLALGARGLLPLVQVTPRGVWGKSMVTTWTTAEDWFGAAPPPADPERALEDLVRRYLAAFGPATVADVQRWSGLTRLGAVVQRIRAELVELRHVDGTGPARALWDLPDAPRPDPDVPAPVRFLPDFDQVLLGHGDRSRIVPPEVRPALASRNGMPPGTVLVDGLVAGTWTLTRSRTGDAAHGRREHARLEVAPLRRWTRGERAQATAEGEQVARFLADAADAWEVVVV
jgi:hypothetical protein